MGTINHSPSCALSRSLWLGMVTLKHPEARYKEKDMEKGEEERQHVQRRNDVEVHLLLSRSRHGEVRLQQNRYFSTEKGWIKRNIKKEIRSDFQMKYSYTNTVFTEKKDGNTTEIRLYEKAERRPRYGGYGVTPRLGNWGIKSLERDLWPYSTLAYVGTQSLNIQEATQHQGAV